MNYIISLGGSLINPGKVDLEFLKSFRTTILKLAKPGNEFFIVAGGGSIARQYQKAAKQFGKIGSEDLDWIGIAATGINAKLLEAVLGKRFKIFSGEKPGASTDYVAVKLAKKYKAETVINLSNVDYVYDKDPKKHKIAKKFKRLSWDEYLKLIGRQRQPGGNYPFDPVAAKLAKKEGIKVVVMNGRKFRNFQNFLQHKVFKGTIIE